VLAASTNSSTSAAEAPAASSAVTLPVPDQQVPVTPVYNAFEFIYRSDFGKIILREQNVDTGQEVTQVPSEYHLQQYAATQRAQRVQQQEKLLHLEAGGPQPRSGVGAKATGATGKTSATTVSTGQGAPAPAPAPETAAPAAPVVAAAGAAPAHVDIKV